MDRNIDVFSVAMEYDYYGDPDDFWFSVMPRGKLVRGYIDKRRLKYSDGIVDYSVECDVDGIYDLDILVMGEEITIFDVFRARSKYVNNLCISDRLKSVDSLNFRKRVLLTGDAILNYLHRDIVFCDRNAVYGTTFKISKERLLVVDCDEAFFSLYGLRYDQQYEGKRVIYNCCVHAIVCTTNEPLSSNEDMARSLDDCVATIDSLKQYLEKKLFFYDPIVPINMTRFTHFLSTVLLDHPLYSSILEFFSGNNGVLLDFELSRLEGLKLPEALKSKGMAVTPISSAAYLAYAMCSDKLMRVLTGAESALDEALIAMDSYVYGNYVPRPLDKGNYDVVIDRNSFISLQGVNSPLVMFIEKGEYIISSSDVVVSRGTTVDSDFSMLVCEEVDRDGHKYYEIIDCHFFRGKNIRWQRLSIRLIYRDMVFHKDIISKDSLSLRRYYSVEHLLVLEENAFYVYPDISMSRRSSYGVYEWTFQESNIYKVYRLGDPNVREYIRTHPRQVVKMERDARIALPNTYKDILYQIYNGFFNYSAIENDLTLREIRSHVRSFSKIK